MASLLMSRLSKRKLSPPAAHSDGGLPLSARSPDAQRRSPTPTARLRRSEESWSTRWIGGSAAVALLLLLLLLNATFASRHFGALLWSATTNVGRDAARRFEIGEGAAEGAAGGAAIPGSANENSDAEAELNALCPAPPHCTHRHKTICRPAAQLATAQAEGAAAAHLERLRCANGSAERLAIIVPLRNRTAHARRFRREFSAQLARWEVNATIVFVEQTTAGFFNVRWSPRPLRRPSPALVHCARARHYERTPHPSLLSRPSHTARQAVQRRTSPRIRTSAAGRSEVPLDCVLPRCGFVAAERRCGVGELRRRGALQAGARHSARIVPQGPRQSVGAL